MSWSSSCPGSRSHTTQRSCTAGLYIHIKSVCCCQNNIQIKKLKAQEIQVSLNNNRHVAYILILENIYWFFKWSYILYLISVLLSFLQDLDAALPLIDKYKEHIVAIGEVRHVLFDCCVTFFTDTIYQYRQNCFIIVISHVGRPGLYAPCGQQWWGKGQSETGAHSTGTSGKTVKPPTVSSLLKHKQNIDLSHGFTL